MDPSLERFTSPDTIVPTGTQGTQAWDRYAFVNNNPVRYNDPTGHGAEDREDDLAQQDGSTCSTSEDGTTECTLQFTQIEIDEYSDNYNYGWSPFTTLATAAIGLIGGITAGLVLGSLAGSIVPVFGNGVGAEIGVSAGGTVGVIAGAVWGQIENNVMNSVNQQIQDGTVTIVKKPDEFGYTVNGSSTSVFTPFAALYTGSLIYGQTGIWVSPLP